MAGQQGAPGEHRWRSHRALAAAVDGAVLLAPLAVASVTLWLAEPLVASLEFAVKLLVLFVISSAAALAAQRVARRAVPLATLLRLTMVFPERAPSRFRVARLAGHPRVLATRMQSGNDDEAEAAATILALLGSLTRHDRKTRGHSERVRLYTDLVSDELALPTDARDRLRWAALLHDIGKLRVSAEILNKPAAPSKTEWEVLREHPAFGADIAAPLLPWLGEWGTGIIEHHERYDGTGYPAGITGDDISYAARIIAVVDSFETMTAVRAYKKAISHKAARQELTRCAGTQFDPTVVRAFLGMSVPRVIWAMGPLSALLQLPWVPSLQYAGGQVVATAATAGLAVAVTAPVALAAVPAVSLSSAANYSRPVSANAVAHGSRVEVSRTAPVARTAPRAVTHTGVSGPTVSHPMSHAVSTVHAVAPRPVAPKPARSTADSVKPVAPKPVASKPKPAPVKTTAVSTSKPASPKAPGTPAPAISSTPAPVPTPAPDTAAGAGRRHRGPFWPFL